MKGGGGRFMSQTVKKERAQTTTWLTPPWLLRRLGRFDLDPCAAPDPRPWPTADRMVTPPRDGLDEPWRGRIFINPPYGLSAVGFIRRLVKHGNGILLVTMRAETNYFHSWVWDKADGMLVLKGRVRFYYPDGTESKGNTGGATVLFAYGETNWKILSGMGDLGYPTRLDKRRTG